ncbi:hypothetical protein IFM89_014320 [Coptis chinensis]|uniref:Small auxin up regulated protein n=1 Tax=Coptis chinensis TaxID=261450 RepID=A0A835HVL7_9MAGN|nr:hypothetical protein IFM89_014320 [Coptis chinensis]
MEKKEVGNPKGKTGLINPKGKTGLINKTLEKCRSIGSGGGKKFSRLPIDFTSKSKSWPCSPDSPKHDKRKTRRQVVPEGCFSVYVGIQRQRFVIKTDCINHPLFKMLLEEAELEYGHNCEGPLVLPCDVDMFYTVLSEIDGDEIRPGCAFAKGYGSYHLVSPSRLVAVGRV